MSRKVVARKLFTLKNDRILDVVSLTNPEIMGYGTQTTILLKVHSAHIDAIANMLVSDEKVRHVLIISGQFKILFSMLFHDIGELHRFVRTDLAILPGITGYESIINLSHYKMSSYLG